MAEAKKRGRPPLSPEEKAIRSEMRNQYAAEYHRRNGWQSQKKYHEGFYEPKIAIPLRNKEKFAMLVKNSGMSISDFCLDAIKDKYGIDFKE